MTPTATASTTSSPASAELAKLVKRREETHAKVRKINAARAAFDAETEAMRAAATQHRRDHPEQYAGGDSRPKPDSEAAKLSAEIRTRLESPNPHEADYLAARDVFHKADEAEARFRRSRLPDLIAEHDSEFDAADDAIRAGLQSLAEGAERYAALVEEVRELIVSTPGINGQALTHDPRPAEWQRIVEAALDSCELTRPGLNEVAAWKLSNG